MLVLFIISVAFVFFTYLGYPLTLACLPKWQPKADSETQLPSVSVVLCVRNAAGLIEAKLKNLDSLTYPRELLEMVVVSDGSSDRTASLARSFLSRFQLRVIELPEHQGKASAINAGVSFAANDIVLFVDARQVLASDALERLAVCFQDSSVGAVSGELKFRDEADLAKPVGVGLYWEYEKMVRRLESRSATVIGATGAIYAIRRNLVPTLPRGLLLDDVYVPMSAVARGYRVLFNSDAIAWDTIAPTHRHEFRRKVRTLYGNLQLLECAPWLLSWSTPAFFRFISHKLFRLFVPFAIGASLFSCVAGAGIILKTGLAVQVAFLLLAALAGVSNLPRTLGRLCQACKTFLILNLAAAVAVIRFVAGTPVGWNHEEVVAFPQNHATQEEPRGGCRATQL